MTTPAILRASRKALSLSQAQAAFMVDTKPRTWKSWEDGSRNMPPAMWSLWCMVTEPLRPAVVAPVGKAVH